MPRRSINGARLKNVADRVDIMLSSSTITGQQRNYTSGISLMSDPETKIEFIWHCLRRRLEQNCGNAVSLNELVECIRTIHVVQ